MTKSTFPNEWLQPLVAEKVSELNRDTMKDFVTVEKKVFDVLQKNNLDLMEKIDKAKKALDFYANEQVYQIYADGIPTEVEQDNGDFARECLKEIEE